MSVQALEALRNDYPRRYGLRAEEVAHVLGRGTTRGAVQRVREGMKSGRYPARKIDGRWQLSLEDLAEILDPTPVATPIIPSASISATQAPTSRRKSAIGPRLAFVRSFQFWAQVFGTLGYREEAHEIEDWANRSRAEGRLARDIERAKALSAAMQAGTASAQPVRRGPVF